MNKKQLDPRKADDPRALRKETLRRLDDVDLRVAAGGARIWRPGFADDTTPISDDTTTG